MPSSGSAAASANDRGVALVVALVVTLLVFLLTTLVLADAFHNVVGSADARARLTAVNAAEAGLAWYSKSLETAGLASLTDEDWEGEGNTWTYESGPGALDSMPGEAVFTVTVTYGQAYEDGEVVACEGGIVGCASFADFTDDSTPSRFWASVRASGTSAGVTRSVEATLELRTLYETFAGAFAGIRLCEYGNRFTITGPQADVYVIGSDGSSSECATNSSPFAALQVTSGQFTTSGSVYVLDGSAYITRSTKITGDLWAKGAITLGTGACAVPGGCGGGSDCSSANKPITVCGDVTSLTAAPVVNVSTAKVLGLQGQCTGCSLPALSFVELTATEAAAAFPTPSPWTPVSAPPLPSLKDPVSANRVIQLACPSPAARTAMPTGTWYLQGDVAIISPCGFNFAGRVDIRAVTGKRPTLYLITTYSTGCALDDRRNISFTQNFDSTAVNLFLYTPCKVSFSNQTNLTGQILSRTLSAQGRTTINTLDVLSLASAQPSGVSGFLVRVLGVREVAS